MRFAAVFVALVTSTALAEGTPPTQAKAPEGQPTGNSTVVVRCMDDCTVRLDGKAGLRHAPNLWEFKDVAPGQRRVEATGGFLNLSLYNGYADIPAGMKVTAQVDSSKRLTITNRIPLSQVQEAKIASGDPSVLNVRCPKQCTVSVDGVRKGASGSQTVVIRDVTPGEHSLEVKFVLGTKVVRTPLNIPAASEVFATATESGLNITNTKPLAK